MRMLMLRLIAGADADADAVPGSMKVSLKFYFPVRCDKRQ